MGAIHVEDSIQIDRPVEDVFSYMADPQHMPEWTAVVVEVRTDASAPLSAGDNFTVAQKFLGTKWESLCEILSSEENRFSYRSVGGPVPFTFTFTCEPSHGCGRGRAWHLLPVGRPPSLRGLPDGKSEMTLRRSGTCSPPDVGSGVEASPVAVVHVVGKQGHDALREPTAVAGREPPRASRATARTTERAAAPGGREHHRGLPGCAAGRASELVGAARTALDRRQGDDSAQRAPKRRADHVVQTEPA